MLGFDPKPRVIKYKLMGKPDSIPVIFYDGEVWLTQKQIADLYHLQISTVNEHLKRITGTPEYPLAEYVHKFKAPGADGKFYAVAHYRLEVVEELGRRTRKNSD